MKRITARIQRPTQWPGALAWLMGALALMAPAVLGVPACSTSSTTTDSACSLNSDCTTGLVCALGKCRNQCVNAADCPVPGSSCIDDGRSPVCQTPAEKNTPCTKEADCPTPLACASDYRCRNLCFSDADCNVLGITGRVCAKDMNGVDYCADPSEVTDGEITVAPPVGAPTKTPVTEPDGGASAVVAALAPGVLIVSNIGRSGGVIGAGGVTVSIPANALTSDVPVSIQLSAAPGPNGTVGEVFEIGPTGTLFEEPITIAFDYTDTKLGNLPPSDFAVETSTDSGASWTPLSQIVVDIYAHTIAGQTMHLSPYALVQQGVSSGTPIDAGAAASGDASASSTEPDVTVSSVDGGSSREFGDAGAATCGTYPPEGGACTAIANVGSTITPTCAAGAVPTGTGGVVADGTYVLTSETFYADACPQPQISRTLVLSGSCYQSAENLAGNDAGTASESGTFVLQGNQVTSAATCLFPPGTPGDYTKTFTATGTAVTLFYSNASTTTVNPNYVDVFTKQP